MPNQNAEQIARDRIDALLRQSGWTVQSRSQTDLNTRAVAIREYPTDAGPADYALFLDRQPVAVVEPKPPRQ